MPIGPTIRRLFGPLEPWVARVYRGCFTDIRAIVRQVRKTVPVPQRVLEVGCGEGAVAELLANAYPTAAITGIDITPRVGRLYRGDPSRVAFRRQTIGEYAAENPVSCDLVMICDVMHHVPADLHGAFLAQARRALEPGGVLVLKEWERRGNLINAVAYFLERYVTGDRVTYRSREDWLRLVRDTFGPASVVSESRLRPWVNNLMFIIRNDARPDHCNQP